MSVISVRIPKDEAEALRHIAEERGRSVSALVREAMDIRLRVLREGGQ